MIIIPLLAALMSFGVAMVLTRLITWKRRKTGRLTKRRRLVTFFIILFLSYFLGGFIYFGIYTHATDHALEFMNGTDLVHVEEISDGYFFNGPGSRDALIFYPGAKIDEKAYAELMVKLAESGIDCFLVKMPLHMAIFGGGKAGSVMEKYEYPCWYIGGHSLGGAMAAIYMAKNPENLKGALLLAGYSEEQLPEGVPIYSIVAENDKVLNWDKYNECKKKWPLMVKEITIKGGNHSQFGDYGLQKGDGEATISCEEQMKQVVEAAVEMIKPDPDYGVTD